MPDMPQSRGDTLPLPMGRRLEDELRTHTPPNMAREWRDRHARVMRTGGGSTVALSVTSTAGLDARGAALAQQFPHWEKIGDCIDNFIDVFENYRQSGHPGGSRSKRHMLVALTLGGFMRWDIRHPEKRFGDRFILVAGHTVPFIYATLAAYNTALRAKYDRTGDPRYAVPEAERRQSHPRARARTARRVASIRGGTTRAITPRP